MSNVAEITAALSEKIDKLIASNGAIKQQLEKSKGETEQYKQQLKNKEEEINEFQEKIKILKLAKSMTVIKGQSPDLKFKINELVREIDNCIAMLNK